MSIASLAELDARIAAPYQIIPQFLVGNPAIAGRSYSSWLGTNGLAPGAGGVPTRATLGAVGQENGGATALRIPALRVSNGTSGAVFVLCDRLSHQSGLDATVTTPQTTNFPTAALTRYTDGVGVHCALEIYSQIGATAAAAVVEYTNEAGTTGRVSPAVAFGATGFRELARMVLIPNQAGDKGFRAVANVDLDVSTVGAGDFGVTLFKPLLYASVIGVEEVLFDPIRGLLGGGLPEILDDACLFWMITFAPGPLPDTHTSIRFAED